MAKEIKLFEKRRKIWDVKRDKAASCDSCLTRRDEERKIQWIQKTGLEKNS